MSLMNEIKLGTRVMSKKTGLPSIGTVVALEDFAYAVTRMQGMPKRWLDLYPDCNEKPVVVVVLDNPQRNLSYEEYLSHYSAEPNSINSLSYKMIPLNPVQSFPVDDLEVFD